MTPDRPAALVTGSASGIGRAAALRLARAGYDVAINYSRSEAAARQTLAELDRLGGRHLALRADVSDDAAVAALAAEAGDTFGRLDVLVNNAGILTFAPIAEMTLNSFRRVLDVNAVGCWLGMKAVIEPMKRAGGGSIVNISSIEGFTGAAGLSAYSASKFAVRGMTKAAAQELAAFGIRVNSVHPGGVLTRMVVESEDARAESAEAFMKAMPLHRFAEPVEISRLVAYLASDESSYSTGSEFVADGGLLSGPGY
jgi:3alpha(or 20beta)-hydroxysteroid dehydrogenase